MTPGEEFQLLLGIETMREKAPQLVPIFESLYDFLKLLQVKPDQDEPPKPTVP